MNLHPTTRLARSGHGAACALTLALTVSFAAVANLGVAVAGKRAEAPAPVVAAADPVARMLEIVAGGADDPAALLALRPELALHVAALAAVAADDDDARQAAAIAALGIAGTPEAREALAQVVECGSPVDAELALAALGQMTQPCAVP